jgi:hypothetical protein
MAASASNMQKGVLIVRGMTGKIFFSCQREDVVGFTVGDFKRIIAEVLKTKKWDLSIVIGDRAVGWRETLGELLPSGGQSCGITCVRISEENADEELVDLSFDSKAEDPFLHARIQNEIDGVIFAGEVEDVEMGAVSGVFWYMVQYDDGDREHMVAEQVHECLANPREE